jgi:hypothetical protein
LLLIWPGSKVVLAVIPTSGVWIAKRIEDGPQIHVGCPKTKFKPSKDHGLIWSGTALPWKRPQKAMWGEKFTSFINILSGKVFLESPTFYGGGMEHPR